MHIYIYIYPPAIYHFGPVSIYVHVNHSFEGLTVAIITTAEATVVVIVVLIIIVVVVVAAAAIW